MRERIWEGFAKEEIASIFVARAGGIFFCARGANEFLTTCDYLEMIFCFPKSFCKSVEIVLDGFCALIDVTCAELWEWQADGAFRGVFRVVKVDGGNVIGKIFAVRFAVSMEVASSGIARHGL